MKKTLKIILSLVLVILFLITCFAGFAILSFASWLHTYKTFTQKELVAIIEVQEGQIDEDGFEYAKVKYTPVDDESALTKVFSSRGSSQVKFAEEKAEEHEIYGDYILVGGQYIKFKDFWNLFNLKNIYKVTRLQGEYSDPEVADDLPNEKEVIVEINGGIDDYWKMFEKNDDQFGFLVDTVEGNYASKFVQDEKKVYGLYVTEDGFLLDRYEE